MEQAQKREVITPMEINLQITENVNLVNLGIGVAAVPRKMREAKNTQRVGGVKAGDQAQMLTHPTTLIFESVEHRGQEEKIEKILEERAVVESTRSTVNGKERILRADRIGAPSMKSTRERREVIKTEVYTSMYQHLIQIRACCLKFSLCYLLG